MALPLGWLGWLSVSGEHGATLAHYRDVFTDLALRKALWNTVVLAFWVGLIFIVAIYTFPYVYIMVANTLALIASDLEEAAAILGAGRLTVARTVTLPMVLPALASGFILAVLQALALFGSPAILALPAGF